MKKKICAIGSVLLASSIISCGPSFPSLEKGDFVEITDIVYHPSNLKSDDASEKIPYLNVFHIGQDQEGIKNFQFYVNDVLIHDVADSMPNNKFYAAFDSCPIGDDKYKILLNDDFNLDQGEYTVKVIITDKKDNSVEDSKTFRVKK